MSSAKIVVFPQVKMSNDWQKKYLPYQNIDWGKHTMLSPGTDWYNLFNHRCIGWTYDGNDNQVGVCPLDIIFEFSFPNFKSE